MPEDLLGRVAVVEEQAAGLDDVDGAGAADAQIVAGRALGAFHASGEDVRRHGPGGVGHGVVEPEFDAVRVGQLLDRRLDAPAAEAGCPVVRLLVGIRRRIAWSHQGDAILENRSILVLRCVLDIAIMEVVHPPPSHGLRRRDRLGIARRQAGALDVHCRNRHRAQHGPSVLGMRNLRQFITRLPEHLVPALP